MFMHINCVSLQYVYMQKHITTTIVSATAVPPFSGPSDRRTPAMGGHFSHVRTTF